MGQLTNQYVSQSYQGLLNLENANTGVTSTLQYVTDGIGNRIPMLASTSSVVITGSFRGDGSGLTGITANIPAGTVSGSQQIVNLGFATTSSLNTLSGSIAVTDLGQDNRLTSLEQFTGSINTGYVSEAEFGTYTSSMNNFTTSIDSRVDALEIETGSLQNQINQKLNTSSFNSYTSSNDAKVNDLISKTGSYATTGSNIFNGTQTITGSFNITGNISATSASFQYVNTIYETASVIYSSGSNQFGDASNDTQTLWGTVNLPTGPLVITGSVTASAGFVGNLTGTASYATQALSASYAPDTTNTGSLVSDVTLGIVSSSIVVTKGNGSTTSFSIDNVQSSSFATNALSSSHAINATSASYSNNSTSSSFAQDAVSSSFAQNAVSSSYSVNSDTSISSSFAQNATSASFAQTSISSSFADNAGLLNGTGSGVFATTGSNTFVGDQTITGSLVVSGSQNIIRGNVDVTGSLNVRSGSLEVISNNTTINPDLYLTSSQPGQSNIILGWSENPSAAGLASNQANYTGSYRITGSNNIVTLPILRPTSIDFNTTATAYISGSGNIITSNGSGILLNGGSLLFPKTQGNFLSHNSNIYLNLITSSIAGGHPVIQNNLLFGGTLDINHTSGTFTANGNAVLNGTVTSTQTFVTNVRPTIVGNNIIGSVNLNDISSSILYQQNYNNSALTINNHLSSSGIANNSLSFFNNAVFGGSANTPLNIWVSGSQSSNVSRLISDNLIGGRNIIISSSFVSSSNANTVATVIYGNALSVSGSHTTGTNGGSAFFGRFNATGSLQESTQDTIFVVGSGTAVGARRNAIRIDNNSNTTITGSLGVTGSVNINGNTLITGSLTLSGSINPELIVIGDTVMTGSLRVTGSLISTGSIEIASSSGDFYIYGHKMFNTAEFWSTQTQSGSAGVSGSINFNNSGSLHGVSLVNGTDITVANAGTYNIQFSAQIETSAGADTAYVWYKKNGTNIADSATKVSLANNTAQVMTVNIIDEASANDYYNLGYQFTNGNATILAETASGNIPVIPSVIATVTQVR